MTITEHLLEQLGGEKISVVPASGSTAHRDAWRVKSLGYHFFFVPVVGHAGLWFFWVGTTEDRSDEHCVTDLEECFGIIAENLYNAGKRERSRQLKELLELDHVE